MKETIHQSENLLIIQLQAALLENIVEKKLLCFLDTESFPVHLLIRLYKPVEQALIETVLSWKEGESNSNGKSPGN